MSAAPAPQRFAIIGEGRTGSSHLVRVLNGHPQVRCHYEVFHGKTVHAVTPELKGEAREALRAELLALRKQDPMAYLERIYALGGGRPVVGFKIFGKHNPPMLEHIMAERSIRKVVLFRANALARYASLMAAHETGEWSSGVRTLVHFDAEEFLGQYDRYLLFIDQTIRALADTDQPFRVVRYDELNNHALMNALTRFLGASERLPEPDAREANRASPNILTRFANPKEVEAFLRERGVMHWAYEGDTLFTPPEPLTGPLLDPANT
jgi:hypothetical protein